MSPLAAARDPRAALHQPGIATRQQAHLALAAFDLASGSPQDLLAVWSEAAAGLMAAGHDDDLTVTLGVGPGLFAPGRFGLEDRRPIALHDLPAFTRDDLDPRWCGGDLVVQACAASAGAAARAVDALPDGAIERWRQLGTMPRRTAEGRRLSPRSPWGFIEGARNLRRPTDLDRHVWTGRGDRPWMVGGTYLVVRRIRLLSEIWDALGPAGQQEAMGSDRRTGAPLGIRGSHTHMTAPETNGGAGMLRRSYGYADRDERGLIFLAFMRDPRRQYVPMQRRLDEHDPLSRSAVHTGSAVFALPPAGFVL